MKIKKIRLRDYKRFHDLTIDLDGKEPRIVALVGQNGCGKSSVFDGLLFLNNAYSILGAGSSLRSDSAYHSLKKEKNFSYDHVEIILDQGEFLNVRNAKMSEGKDRTIFSFRSSFRYNEKLDVREQHAVNQIVDNDYGATTAADLDKRIDQSYRRLKIYYEEYLNEQDCKPSEAKFHILGELNKSISNCLGLEITDLGNIGSGEGTFFFKKPDSDAVFSFNVLSSGEKEVIDLIVDLYLRRQYYSDTIYIIDEPELHLNTSIQRKLLLEINKIIPDNCQLWIATHSIGFLRALQTELNETSEIFYFDEGKKWASEAYTLKPQPKNRSTWLEIFKIALDDLSSLLLPEIIVYCEGRDKPTRMCEERGLDAIVYNTIFSTEHPEVLFVSSGGNTELDQRSDIAFAILSKAMPDIRILVLKDRDMASGKPTDEKDRQIYLKNNKDNHRVLKRWEIENYLFDKEVLKAYCAKEDTTFDDEAYNNLVKNIQDDNVKEKVNQIKNICGVTGSINPETFKKTLAGCIDSSMAVYKELDDVIFHRK